MTDYEDTWEDMWNYYAEKVDTEQPVENGDIVEVSQISGITDGMVDYPVTGEVVKVEPRGVGTHNIYADWFVRVGFTEEQLDGAVYKGTTELYCVGGTKRDWDEIPVEVKD